jgi:hypothetical protein
LPALCRHFAATLPALCRHFAAMPPNQSWALSRCDAVGHGRAAKKHRAARHSVSGDIQSLATFSQSAFWPDPNSADAERCTSDLLLSCCTLALALSRCRSVKSSGTTQQHHTLWPNCGANFVSTLLPSAASCAAKGKVCRQLFAATAMYSHKVSRLAGSGAASRASPNWSE